MGSVQDCQEVAQRPFYGVKPRACVYVMVVVSQSTPTCLRRCGNGTAGKSESCDSPYGHRHQVPAHISFLTFRRNN